MGLKVSETRLLKKISGAGATGLGLTALNEPQRQDLAALKRHDLACLTDHGSVILTAEGKAHLKRLKATAGEAYRDQHIEIETLKSDNDRPIMVNVAESPLARLYFRKNQQGERLVDDAEFAAGERLRADFERAGLSAKTGLTLTPRVDCSRKSDGLLNTMDVAIEARARVNAALQDVGEEFGSILLDVCCFLKGLEWVEKERRWPVRSAKVVLKLGLRELARHYGLSNEARGKRQRY